MRIIFTQTLLVALAVTATPLQARFTSVDPAREFHNPYNYVGNNPIVHIDPNGEAHVDITDPNKKALVEKAITQADRALGGWLSRSDATIRLSSMAIIPVERGSASYNPEAMFSLFFQPIDRLGSMDKTSLVLINIHPDLLKEGAEVDLAATLIHEGVHGLHLELTAETLESLLTKGKWTGDIFTAYQTETEAYSITNNFLQNTLNTEQGVVGDINKHLKDHYGINADFQGHTTEDMFRNALSEGQARARNAVKLYAASKLAISSL